MQSLSSTDSNTVLTENHLLPLGIIVQPASTEVVVPNVLNAVQTQENLAGLQVATTQIRKNDIGTCQDGLDKLADPEVANTIAIPNRVDQPANVIDKLQLKKRSLPSSSLVSRKWACSCE